MAQETTTTDCVETMEDPWQSAQELETARRLRILGYPSRRVELRPLANVKITTSATRPKQCLMAQTRTKEFLETISTSSYLTEPPDADPHVRWCGRGASPPYPDCAVRLVTDSLRYES